MRLVKFLLVEEREIAGVTRVNPISGKSFGEFGDAFVFVHAKILAGDDKN